MTKQWLCWWLTLCKYEIISKRAEAAPVQNQWEGGQNKKLKPMVIISVLSLAYEMQHNCFYAESLVHSRYNYRNISFFGWFTKSYCFVDRCRENSQCRMTDAGVWETEPPAAGGKGIWGESPQRLAIFTIFLIQITLF